jgi:hypothetical protein
MKKIPHYSIKIDCFLGKKSEFFEVGTSVQFWVNTSRNASGLHFVHIYKIFSTQELSRRSIELAREAP